MLFITIYIFTWGFKYNFWIIYSFNHYFWLKRNQHIDKIKIFKQPPDALLPEFDIQRFAAEDEGRTEEPSERRKQEERDKGNVPKSNDISGAVVLLGGVVTLLISGGLMLDLITGAFHKYLGQDFSRYSNFTIETLHEMSFDFFMITAKIVAPVMIMAFLMAIIGNVSQFGLLFTFRAIQLKPEKIIPDFKRVLPVRRNIVNLLKIMMQVAIIGTAAYITISYEYLPLLKTANMELNQAIVLFAKLAIKLLIVTAIILLALAIPDFFYQRFEYMENLKMSVSESKQERKESDGDPLMRQRQKERGVDIRQQRNMLEEVPTADVVITNPTHYSVALKYDNSINGTQAPVVVAKGVDHIAFLIRDIAKNNQIHIEASPQLARTLYADVEIGEEIPEELYKIISSIFSKLARFRSAAS